MTSDSTVNRENEPSSRPPSNSGSFDSRSFDSRESSSQAGEQLPPAASPHRPESSREEAPSDAHPDSSSAVQILAPVLDGDLSHGELVDELCLFFEDAWLRGRQPNLEPLVRGVARSVRADLLRELLAVDLTYRRRHGQNPNPEEYIRRFPDFADTVRQAFPAVSQPAPLEFSPGVIVDRYQIEGELGRGAFGTVFLAQDLELGRQVAIKIPGGPHTATPGQIGRLLEEARSAAQLQHPSIVSLYDVQPLPDGRLYAVMKYVAGRSLREQMDHERLQPAQLAEVFAVIADGLAYAHERGFVHRDLSPSNILLDDALRPMIADFGLALHERILRRRVGEQAGSWSYMAPEQVRGETHRLDGRTDIWALGVMLYEALSGQRPFLGTSPEELAEELAEEIQHRDPKPPRQICREVPRSLEKICLQCMEKSPSARFATAGDLANALRRWNQPAVTRWKRRTLLAALGTLLIPIFFFLLNPSRPDSLPTEPPLSDQREDQVEVLVWRGENWANLDWSGQLPLRTGDQVRVHVQVTRPQFLYIVWIGADGEIAPVYPWKMGDWGDREAEQEQSALELPPGGADHVWTMEAGDLGTELLLVLGRSTPLPADFSLPDLLEDLPSLPPAIPPSALRLDYQNLKRMMGQRHIDPKATQQIRDPAVELQRVLRERLEPDFPLLLGLAFPTGS